MRELCEDLIKTASEQKYMGEQIPEAWLNFEKTLITARTKQSIIKWEELETYASESAIVDKFEVFFHYIIFLRSSF